MRRHYNSFNIFILLFTLIDRASAEKHIKMTLTPSIKSPTYVLYVSPNGLGWARTDENGRYFTEYTKIILEDDRVKVGDKYLCVDMRFPDALTTCNSRRAIGGVFNLLFRSDGKGVLKHLKDVLTVGNYNPDTEMYDAKLKNPDKIKEKFYSLDIKIYEDNEFKGFANGKKVLKSKIRADN